MEDGLSEGVLGGEVDVFLEEPEDGLHVGRSRCGVDGAVAAEVLLL